MREIVPFTNQAKRIEQGLGELQQGDETALYNAIYLASERLGETSQAANRRRVLVVISDGGDSIHGGEKYEQAVERGAAGGRDDLLDHHCADYVGCGTQYGRRACADPDVGGHGRQVLLRGGSERTWSRRFSTCRTTCGRSTCWGTTRRKAEATPVPADQGEADGLGCGWEVLAALPDGVFSGREVRWRIRWNLGRSSGVVWVRKAGARRWHDKGREGLWEVL